MARKKTPRFEPTEFIPKGPRYREQYGVVVICEDFESYRAARVKSLFNAESGANFQLEAELPIRRPGLEPWARRWTLGIR